MKNVTTIYIFILVIFSQIGYAKNDKYISKNTVHAGDWTLNANWMDGTHPGLKVGNKDEVTVEGFIRVNTDLEVGGGVTVNDTLYIDGNLNTKGNPEIIVNGLLIIKGSIITSGQSNFKIKGSGVVVVLDDVSISGNGNGSGNKIITNDGIIYINDTYTTSDFTNTGTANLDAAINMPADLMSFVEAQSGSTLPVELAYFKAVANQGIVELNWATASEENFDYFVIERSKDAINYEPVAQVKGAGWSQTLKTYTYEDINPMAGISYYRLKSVDFDGYTEYFNPVSVIIESEIKPTAKIINNPYNAGMLEVYYQNGNNESAQVRVIDTNGRFIFQATISTGKQDLTLPAGIQQGVYLVNVETRNYSKSFKFMIN